VSLPPVGGLTVTKITSLVGLQNKNSGKSFVQFNKLPQAFTQILKMPLRTPVQTFRPA
jgi:hypothetical protein